MAPTFLTTGHDKANHLCCSWQHWKRSFPKDAESQGCSKRARTPQKPCGRARKAAQSRSKIRSSQTLFKAAVSFCIRPGMIKRCSCLTEWDASSVARWSFLPPASLRVYWFHDHPRIIPLHRVKPGQHGADALSHPVFASLLAQTHLYICLQSNVRALPWDFSRINIWIVISPSNRELLHWFVNAVLLYCVRSPANGKVPFEEAKQPRANTLAPKARSQHSNKSGQISLVKLWWEWFLCGSPRVETQHMLSISVMWWMQ